MSRMRILLADDHRIMVDAIKKMLEPEFDVVGTCQSARELLDLAPKTNPDVIVLDIGMPMMNGLSAAELILEQIPDAKLIFLTMNRDLAFVAEAFRIGASGYVLKNATGRDLVNAIHSVIDGETYTSPQLTEGVEGPFFETLKQNESPHVLTVRQKEVLQLLTEGWSTKQIANLLDISVSTVSYHKYGIMQQLNITSSTGLIAFAKNYLPSIN